MLGSLVNIYIYVYIKRNLFRKKNLSTEDIVRGIHIVRELTLNTERLDRQMI